MLPFTREQFFSVFVDYNLAVWPAQVVAYLIGVVMMLALLRRTPWAQRAVAAGLVAMWAWTGIAYHGLFFSAINKAAAGFAALFVAQALLFAHASLVKQDLRWTAPAGGARGAVAWGLMLYATVLYPLLGLAAGHAYTGLPMFGITPCPVTLFTFGLLLSATPQVPRRLLVIPLVWALIGGSAAFLLGVPQDWPLLIGGLVVIPWMWHRPRATLGTRLA